MTCLRGPQAGQSLALCLSAVCSALVTDPGFTSSPLAVFNKVLVTWFKEFLGFEVQHKEDGHLG